MMRMATPRLAFVVLTYNRSDALLAVLKSLASQCSAGDEVVIADDGSRSEHVQAVRDASINWPCRAIHVWHPDTGFTAGSARNLGASKTKADYLVFMDGDCIPAPGFVTMHRALAKTGQFVNGSRTLLSKRLSVEVQADRVDLVTSSLLRWLAWRAQGDVNKLAHFLRWPGMPGRIQPGFSWKGIRSCNFGVWRADFEAVNGFDETFNGWGHEDADLVLRLHHHGLVRCNGHWATEVFHLWHPENDRANEGANRQRVLDRVGSTIVRSDRGLDLVDAREGVQTFLLHDVNQV